MQVEFLSDDRVAAFGRFVGEALQTDLERCYFLDDADRDLVANRRGEHNRLRFALRLTTVRVLGTFLDELLDVPTGVLD